MLWNSGYFLMNLTSDYKFAKFEPAAISKRILVGFG